MTNPILHFAISLYVIRLVFIPDQDPEANIESEVVRASLRLCRTRYPCIHLAADVLSGLARHQDRVAVKAVDAVLEAMHRGIEVRRAVLVLLGLRGAQTSPRYGRVGSGGRRGLWGSFTVLLSCCFAEPP